MICPPCKRERCTPVQCKCTCHMLSTVLAPELEKERIAALCAMVRRLADALEYWGRFDSNRSCEDRALIAEARKLVGKP